MARMASVTDCTRVYHGAPSLRPPPNASNPAGTARAPLGGVRECTRYPTCRSVCLAPTVGGGVLDAPRSRDRRGALDAHVQRAQPHPCLPRCASLASTTQRMLSRGHSPRTFLRAHPRYPSSHAGRAWKPAPTVGGEVDGQRGCDAPTSAPTPQSRRKAPRQLPFQGSRGWVRRTHVIRPPTPGGRFILRGCLYTRP